MTLKLKHSPLVITVFGFMLALASILTMGLTHPASALSAADQRTAICEGAGGCDTDGTTVPEVIRNVGDILIFIVGGISVLMIIIGAVRYAVSRGDASATKGAKDTILYALIGIVVAVSAYAIVHFVVVNID